LKLLDKIASKIGQLLLSTNIKLLMLIGMKFVKYHEYVDKDFVHMKDIKALLNDAERVSISGTGVLIIVYKEKVIKFPLGVKSKKSLEKEYENYITIKNLSPSLVDYDLEDKDTYHEMDKLFNVSHIMPSFRYVYKTLEKIKIDKNRIDSNRLFNNTLLILQKKCKDIVDFEVIKNNIKNIETMAMHGDLTQYNIMQTKKGKFVMIDLDRFTLDGFKDLDRVHYVVEYYAKRRDKNFFDILNNVLRDKKLSLNSYRLLFLYLLYRIDVEYNEEIILPDKYYTNICKTINTFLNHEYFKAKKTKRVTT